ncbi:MAG: zinc-dependent metalloprotease [Actinomycetota bacterium]
MADEDRDGPGDGDENNPFGDMGNFGMFGMPMFGDLSKMLAGQGPLNWDAARQFAILSASADPAAGLAGMMGGSSTAPAVSATPNVDPTVRIKYEELTGIARPHVADVMGVEVPIVDTTVATPEQWATETLEAYRPLFTELATSLGGGDDPAANLPDEMSSDPMAQMMAGLSKMMAPAMMGMAVGSMVGGLARRAFGVYDLPIPRATPTLVLVPPTIDEFAAEWSISLDEMRLWVLAHELAGLTLFSVPHVADHLRALVQHHVGAFRPDPNALGDKLGSLDVDPTSGNPFEALQSAFNDPEVLLGAVRSDEQLAMEPQLDAAVATTIGVIDWVVDAVAVRLIGGNALQIAEAVRRRRAEASPDDLFVERLLGIRLGADQTARGKAFVQGVVDRAGERGLDPLFTNPEAMPTPNEIEAPGLWLARVSPEALG